MFSFTNNVTNHTNILLNRQVLYMPNSISALPLFLYVSVGHWYPSVVFQTQAGKKKDKLWKCTIVGVWYVKFKIKTF